MKFIKYTSNANIVYCDKKQLRKLALRFRNGPRGLLIIINAHYDKLVIVN